MTSLQISHLKSIVIFHMIHRPTNKNNKIGHTNIMHNCNRIRWYIMWPKRLVQMCKPTRWLYLLMAENRSLWTCLSISCSEISLISQIQQVWLRTYLASRFPKLILSIIILDLKTSLNNQECNLYLSRWLSSQNKLLEWLLHKCNQISNTL